MKPHEMQKFSSLLAQVASIYGKPVNLLAIEIYWQALHAFDFNVVKDALLACVTHPDTGQFMPKPSDILKILKGSDQTRAMQAWSLVLKTIQQVGSYSSVVFDDPVIHAVIMDMGGWIYLCRLLEKETPFRAQEFEKRYVGYQLQMPKSYPKKLIGIHEQENSSNGYPIEPPRFIGNKQRALAVYQNGSKHNVDCRPAHRTTGKTDAIFSPSSEMIY